MLQMLFKSHILYNWIAGNYKTYDSEIVFN